MNRTLSIILTFLDKNGNEYESTYIFQLADQEFLRRMTLHDVTSDADIVSLPMSAHDGGMTHTICSPETDAIMTIEW